MHSAVSCFQITSAEQELEIEVPTVIFATWPLHDNRSVNNFYRVYFVWIGGGDMIFSS